LLKGPEEAEHLRHIIEKDIIRIEKERDIEMAGRDRRVMVVEADNMANFLTPTSDVGIFYYMTKPCNSNLTGYIHHYHKGIIL